MSVKTSKVAVLHSIFWTTLIYDSPPLVKSSILFHGSFPLGKWKLIDGGTRWRWCGDDKYFSNRIQCIVFYRKTKLFDFICALCSFFFSIGDNDCLTEYETAEILMEISRLCWYSGSLRKEPLSLSQEKEYFIGTLLGICPNIS